MTRAAYMEHSMIWFAIIAVAKSMGVTNECSAGWWIDFQEKQSITMFRVKDEIRIIDKMIGAATQRKRASKKDGYEYGLRYAEMLYKALENLAPLTVQCVEKRTCACINDFSTGK